MIEYTPSPAPFFSGFLFLYFILPLSSCNYSFTRWPKASGMPHVCSLRIAKKKGPKIFEMQIIE